MTIPPEVLAAARAAHAHYFPKGPFVSVTIAQWAVESAWGKSQSGKNNFFGIKANSQQIADKQATARWTQETKGGVYMKVIQWFADYPSVDAGFMAHAYLLATSKIYVDAQHAATPDVYALALEHDGYATGIPGHPYGQTLISVMKANNLYAFDGIPAPGGTGQQGAKPMTDPTPVAVATASLPDVTVHAPSVSASTVMDWGSVAAQIIDHAKPIAEAAANAGVKLAFAEIPFASFFEHYITPKLIDQYIDQVFTMVEGSLKDQTISIPATGIAGMVANAIQAAEGPLLAFLNMLGIDLMPKITAAVDAAISNLKLP